MTNKIPTEDWIRLYTHYRTTTIRDKLAVEEARRNRNHDLKIFSKISAKHVNSMVMLFFRRLTARKGVTMYKKIKGSPLSAVRRRVAYKMRSRFVTIAQLRLLRNPTKKLTNIDLEIAKNVGKHVLFQLNEKRLQRLEKQRNIKARKIAIKERRNTKKNAGDVSVDANAQAKDGGSDATAKDAVVSNAGAAAPSAPAEPNPETGAAGGAIAAGGVKTGKTDSKGKKINFALMSPFERVKHLAEIRKKKSEQKKEKKKEIQANSEIQYNILQKRKAFQKSTTMKLAKESQKRLRTVVKRNYRVPKRVAFKLRNKVSRSMFFNPSVEDILSLIDSVTPELPLRPIPNARLQAYEEFAFEILEFAVDIRNIELFVLAEASCGIIFPRLSQELLAKYRSFKNEIIASAAMANKYSKAVMDLPIFIDVSFAEKADFETPVTYKTGLEVVRENIENIYTNILKSKIRERDNDKKIYLLTV